MFQKGDESSFVFKIFKCEPNSIIQGALLVPSKLQIILPVILGSWSIILDLLWCVKKWVYVLLSPSQLLRDISNRVGFYDAYLSSNNILSLLFWHAWLNSLDLMPLDPPKKIEISIFAAFWDPFVTQNSLKVHKFRGLFEIGQLENCRGCRFFQVWKWNIAWLFSEG